ncbi:hypothetical protein EXIGLDRAFT_640417 [Exidia glandulosa HHB12029]|uniref:Uncharacterized protein n=1 Tax=Exidia glandulosa HHB12029 TaxID=1314781 RepID=A0A165MLS1_EXIGL|nr:hypothetical protein EXIGLDRAFT_640417 [Exidia glandulosa HHB12029]
MTGQPQTAEDVLSDALELFGGQNSNDADSIWYGEFELRVAPKEGRANVLLADQLFSPGLFLAEHIELRKIVLSGLSVLELGAGAGLPSILASHPTIGGARLVVASDYPDPLILNNLQENILRNDSTAVVEPFEWGTDPAELLSYDPQGFDVLIMSDLLHFDASHDALLDSATALLKRSAQARLYVCCGDYTKPAVCDAFIANARERGFVIEEEPRESSWKASRTVRGIEQENMDARKRQCRFWIAHWAPQHVTL